MTTALAILPKEQAIEFRRCTGNCCDPVTLIHSPGDLRRWLKVGCSPDNRWIAETLEYVRWRSPADGGWPDTGNYEYRCPHFDGANKRCLVYGQGKRPYMCRKHPEYKRGPWGLCLHSGCTRRTMVVGGECNLRWRFPDLWHKDLPYLRWIGDRWFFKAQFCEATTAPDSGCTEWER